MNFERSHLLELSAAKKEWLPFIFQGGRVYFFPVHEIKNAQSNLAQTNQTKKSRLPINRTWNARACKENYLTLSFGR